MNPDPLASWWCHPVVVARYAGRDAFNEATFDAPVTVTGFYRDGAHVVTTSGGDELVASGRFAYPATVATIPALSRLTLPAVFGGQVVIVQDVAVGDAGPLPTPNHKIAEVQ